MEQSLLARQKRGWTAMSAAGRRSTSSSSQHGPTTSEDPGCGSNLLLVRPQPVMKAQDEWHHVQKVIHPSLDCGRRPTSKDFQVGAKAKARALAAGFVFQRNRQQ